VTAAAPETRIGGWLAQKLASRKPSAAKRQQQRRSAENSAWRISSIGGSIIAPQQLTGEITRQQRIGALSGSVWLMKRRHRGNQSVAT
jgi:hypothetical protein